MIGPNNCNLQARTIEETNNNSSKNSDKDNDPDKCTLTDEEFKQYGNRFPLKYTKGKPLGKGGQGIVFKGTDEKHVSYAIKQVCLSDCPLNQAIKEIELINNIFDDEPIDEMDEDGRQYLMPTRETKVTQKDLFIVMPLGGTSASKLAFNLKGEFHNSERIYNITNGPLYNKLNKDPNFLQDFVRKLVLGLSS